MVIRQERWTPNGLPPVGHRRYGSIAIRPDRSVASQSDSPYDPVGVGIVVARVMHGGAVVPQQDVAWLPTMPVNVLRLRGVIIEQC